MSGLGNPDDDVIPSGESATLCADCGEQIPEARRIAQKGCKFCIECQVKHDNLPQIRTVTKML